MSEHFYVITAAGWKEAPGSFIFSLRNKEDLSPFKAPLKDENTPLAIYTSSSFGPVFGSTDIHISNDAASNTRSYTNFKSYYPVPSGQVSDTRTILAGTKYFQPSEIEVFYMV
jgi:hypothetical protein